MACGNVLCDLTLLITVVVCGFMMEIVVKRCGCSLWVRIERHHVISKMNNRTIIASRQNYYTQREGSESVYGEN